MALVTLVELLAKAQEGRYAVGGFNVFNLESIRAVIEAAEAENAPVILMTEQRDIGFAGMEYLAPAALSAARRASVPVAVHLDHGTDFTTVCRCLREGYSSVMIDASALPFDENVAVVREVVRAAHAAGVSVEAELGRIVGSTESAVTTEDDACLTDPEAAGRFAAQTGVDALAVAIGTAHGVYTREPKLDFARLEAIRGLVKQPLVLHGGSGTPDDSLKRAIEGGIAKINVGTDLRRTFVRVASELGAGGERDVRDVLTPARQQVREIVQERMRVFGSSGRAGR